jgi:glycosyltransferase involved in cell wall biosynthesis
MREALVLRAASAVTATSTPVVDLLARLGVRSQRLPLGVDLSSWPARPPQPRALDRPARLIHVASLNRVKDQSTLLHALAALGQAGVAFVADIVGEDTLQGEIHGLAEQLQLMNRVRFRGFLTQRQLRPLVDAADLMVVSSRHEAGPLVMLEAAVAGVPTVGTAVGHLAEWAPEAAVAVPIGDPQALAQAIEQLLTDEDRRLELARQAQQRAILQDADYTAERFLSVYASLTA